LSQHGLVGTKNLDLLDVNIEEKRVFRENNPLDLNRSQKLTQVSKEYYPNIAKDYLKGPPKVTIKYSNLNKAAEKTPTSKNSTFFEKENNVDYVNDNSITFSISQDSPAQKRMVVFNSKCRRAYQ
jgi:hypothetical protein